MLIILWQTDKQEGYGQFPWTKKKRDALASRSAWADKPNINGPNVLIYRPLSRKKDKWSLRLIKDIMLRYASKCKGVGVTCWDVLVNVKKLASQAEDINGVPILHDIKHKVRHQV